LTLLIQIYLWYVRPIGVPALSTLAHPSESAERRRPHWQENEKQKPKGDGNANRGR
jgi:hypothetical protein